jgi:threonine dehydrogenase-like Zn-dependent dehydrogenase
MAQYVLVPERNCSRVPAGIRPEQALIAEPAVTVLRGLSRTRCGPGDRTLVVGAGTLGLIAVMAAVSRGARVDVVDVDRSAIDAAIQSGASAYADEFELRYDVVIEASGTAAGAERALVAAGPGSRLALLGMPTDGVSVDISRLVSSDVEVHGVLGGVEEFDTALTMIESGAITAGRILGRRFDFADVMQAFADLAAGNRWPPKRYVAIDQPVGSSGLG